MRFSELHLLRYGRFENRRLDFPAEAVDMHIAYGPNEAGKSTTMSAVSDLLFGFPNSSPFDYRFDTKLLRVGASIGADGSELACVRKKGRSATLLDPTECTLDEGALAVQLAGYSREAFARMFSLDHRRLREGGQAILDARDDAGRAIFAAASGIVGVAAVLAKLEEDARAIWIKTRKGGDRLYYRAEKAFEDARARQKAAQIKPAAWDDLNRQIIALDGRIAELERRRGEATAERERVERSRRVLPHAALYRSCKCAVAALGDVLAFPSDAAVTLGEVEATIAAAAFEARTAESQCLDLRAKLALIIVDSRLTDSAAAIEALRDAKGKIDDRLDYLPRRRAVLNALLSNLASHQRELGWPLEDAPSAKARLPQRVRVAGVREFLERRSALEATLADGIAEAAAARDRVSILEDAFAELPPETDLAGAATALKFGKGLGDIELAIRTANKEVDRRRQQLTTEIAALLPWEGGVESLRTLILPSEAETASAIGKAAALGGALLDANKEHQSAIRRGADLTLQKEQILRGRRAVALNAVETARGERNDRWRAIKAHLLVESTLSEVPAAVDDFEVGMDAADAIADQRFNSAEQSARLAALEDEIERNTAAIDQATRAVRQAEQDVAAQEAIWRERLTSPELAVSPEAFGTWRGRYTRALEAATAWEDARLTLEELEVRLDGGRERLWQELQSTSAPVDAETPFGRLLELAERLVDTDRDQIAERDRVDVQLKAASRDLKRADDKLAKAHAAVAGWDETWTSTINAAELSADTTHAVVRTQLELIDTVRAEVDEILALEQRINDMELDVARFNDDVLAIAAACGFDVRGRTAAALLTELGRALSQAGKLDTQASALNVQLKAAEERLASAEADERRALARLDPLVLIAQTGERVALKVAVDAFEAARALEKDMARHGEEIVKAGGDPALDRLLEECDGVEAGVLTLRSQELTGAIETLSNQITEFATERATARADLRRLDAGPDAAAAAADAEQAKAEMAAQVEAYARKRAEIVLLRWAIAKYRSEKQAPLLKRASAVFGRLTLGRYVELLVDWEADKSRLAGLTEDHDVVPVEGMSDGTVDQLFLALRLAAVEEAVDSGSRLPFLADDLFINYDDARSAAGFQVLAELAQKTQVLFFTHHQHLVGLAQQTLGVGVHTIRL